MGQQHLTFDTFDEAGELLSVQIRRKVVRRTRTWSKSRLTPFRSELVKLHFAGGSLGDLQVWLRSKRCKVHRSTIYRYLTKLPEMKHG